MIYKCLNTKNENTVMSAGATSPVSKAPGASPGTCGAGAGAGAASI